MRRIILISLAVIGVLALTVTKLLSNSAEAKKKIYIHNLDAAVLVETANPIANYTFESAFSYLGVFDAMHQNNVASEGSGKLIDLLVKEGAQVQKGQVIAKLDDELVTRLVAKGVVYLLEVVDIQNQQTVRPAVFQAGKQFVLFFVEAAPVVDLG